MIILFLSAAVAAIMSTVDSALLAISSMVTIDLYSHFKPNKKRMIELANSGFITATDLADYMVRELKYPFRKAYSQTAKIINFAEKNKKKLTELKMHEINRIEPKLNEDVYKIFDLKHSINSKTSYGGTSFENIKKMIRSYKKN